MSSSQSLPNCRLLFRSKEGIEIFSVPSDREAESTIAKQTKRQFILQGTTSFQSLHPDGSAAYVHRPELGIFRLKLDGSTPETEGTPFLKDTARVQMMEISPLGNFLLTWERAQEGEVPNLKVWSTANGELITGFRQKTLKREAWPYLQWTNDESLAFLMATNEVRVFPGASFVAGQEVRFVDKLRLQGISSMSLGPSSARVLFTTFTPKDKNKPARASLYEYPSKNGAVSGSSNYPSIMSKSLFQADEMKVHWSPRGDVALISLQNSVDTSGQSYYGSTSLYLMNPVQPDAYEVPLQQEGPVIDVAWMPNPDKPPCFVVINGKMPSMASLHNGNDGKATFVFGNAHRNTIMWAPHGRFLCLAGFGNLAGGMTFWDKNKLKQIPPAQGVTAPCTVGYGWSPDSRLVVSSTTSPRMNVDNGVKLFRYNGDAFKNLPWDNQNYLPDRLLQASFLPALPTVYPDRPQSPTLQTREQSPSSTASEQAAAPKPAGRYIPPSARNRAGRGGGTSLAERMRAEKEAGMKSAQKVADKPKAVRGATGKVVVGLAPAADQGKSKGAMRREKAKQKKEEEAARQALEAKLQAEKAAAAETAAPVDPSKRAKKINKTLRQIEDLKSKDPSELNDDQKAKIATESELREELAKLGI